MTPVVDPVRIFCLNCSPAWDMSGRRPTAVPASEDKIGRSALTYSEQMSLRTYRTRLQVYDLVASGQGEHLHGQMLDYGRQDEPDEYIYIVAKFLVTTEPPLLEERIEDVVPRLKASVDQWKARAMAVARQGRGQAVSESGKAWEGGRDAS